MRAEPSAIVVRLCGGLVVEEAGRRLELPGRQGRLLFAFLVLNRDHPVTRDQLIEVLWTDRRPPTDPGAALNVLLTRLRGTQLGRNVVTGRAQLVLALPPDTEVDVEMGLVGVHAAQAALESGRLREALEPARLAAEVLALPLLPEFDAGWIEERRLVLAEQRALALEALSEAGLGLGGSELRAAERAARVLVEQEPYRESGHVLLMRCLAAAGNVAEALRTFDHLRTLLREEMGVTPSPSVVRLNEQILSHEERRAASSGDRAARRHGGQVPLPPALRPRRGARLYGRASELERLRTWWHGTQPGLRLCVLSGDAGIGKTRLAGELAGEARADGAIVLYGRCDEDAPVPYQPLVEALRHLVAHRLPSWGAEENLDVGELTRLVPELRTAGFAPQDRPVDDPALRRHLLFDAVCRLLADAARDTGLLLMLDDLHLADDPTVALLRHVLRLEVPGRLGIVAVHRHPELSPDHPVAQILDGTRRERPCERILVGGLDLDALTRFVTASVPDGASQQFLLAIHRYTGGNPLFVEEVLLELMASRLADGRAVRPDDLTRVGVPEGVQVVLARRLARLGSRIGETLADAAVIGPEFGLDALEVLMESADPLPAVEAGLRAGLLVEQGDAGRLAFSHALVHDAIYGLHSGPRRARVHGRVARILERRPELSGSLAEIARHWTAAGERKPALTASLRAARAAAEVSAFGEAVRLYERSIELWPQASVATGEDLCDVIEAAAEAARWAGDPGNAAQLARRALTLIGTRTGADEAHRARLHERLGRYLWEAGDWESSLGDYEEALRLLEQLPPSVEAARALAGHAALLMLRERFSASLVRARDALRVARTVGARREESHALNTLGVSLGMSGQIDEGIEAVRESLRIAEEVHDLEDQCRAYCNLSELLVRAGRVAEAVEFGVAGYRFAREHRLERSGAPIVAANAVAALARLGRWDEADALTEESLADSPPAGVSAYLRIVRAQLMILRGDVALARADLVDTAGIVRDAFEPALVVELQAAHGELALVERDHRAARTAVERGLDVLEEGDGSDLTLQLCALGMRVVFEAGADGDRGWATTLVERARALCIDLAGRGALLPEAAAFAVTIDAEWGRLRGEPGIAARWASVVSAWGALNHAHAAARAQLAQAQALMDEGRADEARTVLAQAAEVAERLGAEPLRREAAHLAAQPRFLTTPGQGTSQAPRMRAAAKHTG